MSTEIINEHYDIDGNELHITGQHGDIEVWLNTEVADFDGVCIGGGESRQEAVTDGIAILERALKALKEHA